MRVLTKTIINLMVVVLLAMSCFGLTGCKKDIKTVELTLALYDYENEEMYEDSEVTITIDLYRHLAPKTVDKMVEYVNEGYYDNAIFYKMVVEGRTYNQIMLGDLKWENGEIKQNAIKPTIEGEFTNGGTKGSNLTNVKGAIGLWRTWTAFDDEQGDSFQTSSATDTGRATWYMPTIELSSYNDWMCVFGQILLDDEATSTAIDAITNAFSKTDRYNEYVVYYTGEYDIEKVNENHGLEFHCVEKETFDEDMEGLFKAEGSQYACYNYYIIQVPVIGASDAIGAKVVSAKVI